MKIEFIKTSQNSGKTASLTLQKKGRLILKPAFREAYSITIDDYFKIGRDVENRDQKIFYLLKVKEKEPDSIKINKSGEVYFLNLSATLHLINVDSQNKKYNVNHSIVEVDNKKFIKIVFEEKK